MQIANVKNIRANALVISFSNINTIYISRNVNLIETYFTLEALNNQIGGTTLTILVIASVTPLISHHLNCWFEVFLSYEKIAQTSERINRTPKINYTPNSPSIESFKSKLVMLGDIQTTDRLCTLSTHDGQ